VELTGLGYFDFIFSIDCMDCRLTLTGSIYDFPCVAYKVTFAKMASNFVFTYDADMVTLS